MNPEQVAQMDQATAGMRDCGGMLARMAAPLISLGVPAETAARIALELFQTILFYNSQQQEPSDD